MPRSAFERMPPERRDALLRTAATEFAAAGYERASLNKVIRECGMSKSSFYHVVESKQELFEYVIRDLGAALARAVDIPDPAAFGDGRFWERAAQLWSEVSAATEDDAFVALGRMFYLSGTPDAATGAVRSTLAAAEAWLDAVLEVGRRSGDVRDDLPVDLQRALVFSVLRAMDEWMLSQLATVPTPDLETIGAAAIDALRRLLAP